MANAPAIAGSRSASGVVAASFPKSARLRKPAEFKWVAAGRERASRAAISASYRINGGTSPRLGLAIAKKSASNATDRNRIKRLIREDFRHQRSRLPAVDLVFHVRPGIAGLGNAELRATLAVLWKQVIERCARSSLPPSAPTS